MSSKQLINSVESCVDDCLLGFSRLHPHLASDFTRKIVYHIDSPGKGVALVSGGGSGHEPFPAGYVGEGMLTASVSGQVFTSPVSGHVLQAIRVAATKHSGVLLLVPNYTGDVLNFGLAIETALGEGLTVDSVIVGEDVVHEIGGPLKAGKRGMCGLVLVFKIAGYLARIGDDLETVKHYAEEAVMSLASMGMCVTPCSKPGVGPLFQLEDNEVEIGVGVHGEAGVSRNKMMTAHAAVEVLLIPIIRSLQVVEGDEVVVMLNNLGSLSYIEQWSLTGELERQLREMQIIVSRLYSGRFFTSLNMAGFQICVLKLKKETKELFLTALDDPTTASAWPRSFGPPIVPKDLPAVPLTTKRSISKKQVFAPEHIDFIKRCFLQISEDLTKQENHLNFLDSVCGDGDCGTTLRTLADIFKDSPESLSFCNPAALFSDLSTSVEEYVGGTTGAIYGLFFKGCSKGAKGFDGSNIALAACECWHAGVENIKKYSSARIGDRTMLDALEVAYLAFERELELTTPEEAFSIAVTAAREGCDKTKLMKAGRASYTDRQKDVDAGAFAVTVWLASIEQVLDESRTT